MMNTGLTSVAVALLGAVKTGSCQDESLTDVALDDAVAFAVGVRCNGVLLLRAVNLALDDDLERLLGNGALLESS